MSVAEENRPASPAPKARLLILLTGVLWSLTGVFIKSLDLHPEDLFRRPF